MNHNEKLKQLVSLTSDLMNQASKDVNNLNEDLDIPQMKEITDLFKQATDGFNQVPDLMSQINDIAKKKR